MTRTTAGVRRAGSAALDLADVAAGRFDAFWELILMPWDFAAGALLIAEAGGLITDAHGNTLTLDPSSVVAGNPGMHRWMLETLKGEEGRGKREARIGERGTGSEGERAVGDD